MEHQGSSTQASSGGNAAGKVCTTDIVNSATVTPAKAHPRYPTGFDGNLVHIHASSLGPCGKEIEQRAEDQSDVPGVGKAFDKPKQEARPAQPNKAR